MTAQLFHSHHANVTPFWDIPNVVWESSWINIISNHHIPHHFRKRRNIPDSNGDVKFYITSKNDQEFRMLRTAKKSQTN